MTEKMTGLRLNFIAVVNTFRVINAMRSSDAEKQKRGQKANGVKKRSFAEHVVQNLRFHNT